MNEKCALTCPIAYELATDGSLRDSLDASGEAWAASGRSGSRGTGPRPDPFNPWDWWRERRRRKADDRARAAQRPWASVIGDRGAAAGFDIAEGLLDPDDVDRVDELGSMSPVAAAAAAASASRPEELEAYAEEVADEVVHELGPDPVHGIMMANLRNQRDSWERYKQRTEAQEGVAYELGYLLPAWRRGRDIGGASKGAGPGMATSTRFGWRGSSYPHEGLHLPYGGWRAGIPVGGYLPGLAGSGDVVTTEFHPAAPKRQSSGRRPSRQDLVERVIDGGRTVTWSHGREPPPPEAQPFVTAGDVSAMWCPT